MNLDFMTSRRTRVPASSSSSTNMTSVPHAMQWVRSFKRVVPFLLLFKQRDQSSSNWEFHCAPSVLRVHVSVQLSRQKEIRDRMVEADILGEADGVCLGSGLLWW